MKTVCETNQCAGCMACVDICPKGAITIKDDLAVYNAAIDENKCIQCGACHRVCQSNNPYPGNKPISWYQGWTIDSDLRRKSSSGGAATAIAKAFTEAGGVVCGCMFKDGNFIFDLARSRDEVLLFVGSKYVKSNPIGAYKKVKEELLKGNKVLFIGLPCQVSAMKRYIPQKIQDELYTVDLICHGSPSPKLLELFLRQYNRSLSSMKKITFRVKAEMQIHGDDIGIVTKGVSDKYTIAFLNSLTYTENCYSCHYAKIKRVSDLTLGDSWGTELPITEIEKGVSLLLCQTLKGNELCRLAGLKLTDVDLQKAVSNNHQLQHPSIKPSFWGDFFNGIRKGVRFNRLIFRFFPKQCLKQDIKNILIKVRFLKAPEY